MKMMPSKTKFRKVSKGKIHGHAYAGAAVSFGVFAIKSLEPARMTAAQIEAARRCISRAMKRAGKLWCRVFPHTPVTAKAADSRMGGGKGNIERYVAKVRPGNVIFEIDGVTEDVAKEAFRLAGAKLPFDVKFVKKDEGVYAEY